MGSVLMKKKIIAVCICAVLACGMCGCNNSGEVPAAENPTAEETETPETISETSAAAEAETETSKAEESTENSLTVSPSGYVLDPSVTLGEHEYAYMFAENQPCFIDETGEGVRVYGVNTDTEREYHYINPFEEYFSTKSCVILEHNGIAEEFAGEWGERFGTAMSVYSDDFDGDGETEIATCRYDTGGTFCRVMELVLYKQKDGRYEQIVFSANDFNKEYITVDIDNEKKSLTLSINGFDKLFSYDFSEVVPPEMTEFKLNMLQVNDFAFDGGKITYKVTPLLTSYAYEMFADISFTLDLSDGEFVCTNVEFIKEEF